MSCTQVMCSSYPYFSYNQHPPNNSSVSSSSSPFCGMTSTNGSTYQSNIPSSLHLTSISPSEPTLKKFRTISKIYDTIESSSREPHFVPEYNPPVTLVASLTSTSLSTLSPTSLSIHPSVTPSSSPPENIIKEEHKINIKTQRIRSPTTSTYTPGSTATSSNQAGEARAISDRATGVIILNNDRKIITYYNGIEEAIQEHFKRALPTNDFLNKYKDVGPPMKDRILPDSFWNINAHSKIQHLAHHPHHHHHRHQLSSSQSMVNPSFPILASSSPSTSTSNHDLYTTDPYHHSFYSIHHQNDAWHYPYSAHHRAASTSSMSDFSYPTGSNRFNAQYSHLLLPPTSMRTMTASCTSFDKSQVTSEMHWPGTARYQDFSRPPIDTNYSTTAAYAAISNNVHESSAKDHIWF